MIDTLRRSWGHESPEAEEGSQNESGEEESERQFDDFFAEEEDTVAGAEPGQPPGTPLAEAALPGPSPETPPEALQHSQ